MEKTREDDQLLSYQNVPKIQKLKLLEAEGKKVKGVEIRGLLRQVEQRKWPSARWIEKLLKILIRDEVVSKAQFVFV